MPTTIPVRDQGEEEVVEGGEEEENPYEGHPQLSPLQAQILGEYVKLNKSLKSLTTLTRELNNNPNDALLLKLRSLERQMGLVLTLFKASVWSLVTSQQQRQEDEEYNNNNDNDYDNDGNNEEEEGRRGSYLQQVSLENVSAVSQTRFQSRSRFNNDNYDYIDGGDGDGDSRNDILSPSEEEADVTAVPYYRPSGTGTRTRPAGRGA